ncbi:MAG: DUF4093 domain-containing protein [Oscillospiraceae bacterium]|nr:DUF4093 domain-containing protein [Oscillospiraceae bacterium]MDD3832320.1 DUF4093 domain-containing protein [Oscillospiraceae bacterium]MDD4545737.1 DUF4093 domain-containing protein [Oscillospiraceae bacterium]
MIRIREVIVVEGKYDKIRLNSVVDTLVIETNGFGIFKDGELLNMIRLLARERGLLILTDSDSAGFVIRDYLSGSIPPDQIKHAYIPPLSGKERRKTAPSKEGLLGVEGIECGIIEDVLRRAGATIENETVEGNTSPEVITKLDLYAAGLTGGQDSAERRRRLYGLLGLPKNLSTNRLISVLNSTMSRDKYIQTMHDFKWF